MTLQLEYVDCPMFLTTYMQKIPYNLDRVWKLNGNVDARMNAISIGASRGEKKKSNLLLILTSLIFKQSLHQIDHYWWESTPSHKLITTQQRSSWKEIQFKQCFHASFIPKNDGFSIPELFLVHTTMLAHVKLWILFHCYLFYSFFNMF